MGSSPAITTTLKRIGHVADSIFTYLTVLVGYLLSFEVSLGGRAYQLKVTKAAPTLPPAAPRHARMSLQVPPGVLLSQWVPDPRCFQWGDDCAPGEPSVF